MIKYAVVQISGKQFLVEPGKPIEVDFLGDEAKNFTAEQVLLKMADQLEIGMPFLKDSLEFEVIGSKKDKFRVATFHAKANYRRIKGAKTIKTILRLQA
jgi:ribosomal protein L21